MPPVCSEYADAFIQKHARAGFVRKTFFLLTLQVLVTFGMCAVLLLVEPARDFVQRSRWLYWVAIGVAFATLISLVCNQRLLRHHPYNLVALGAFTASFGFAIATVVAFHDQTTVLIAVGVTAALVAALALFASQTRVDFTLYSGLLFVSLVGLLVFGILMIFFYSRVMHIVYASLGAVLFSAYLVYDTQLLLGGKTHSLGPDDYVLACLLLYLDVMNLFLFVLQLVGLARD